MYKYFYIIISYKVCGVLSSKKNPVVLLSSTKSGVYDEIARRITEITTGIKSIYRGTFNWLRGVNKNLSLSVVFSITVSIDIRLHIFFQQRVQNKYQNKISVTHNSSR